MEVVEAWYSLLENKEIDEILTNSGEEKKRLVFILVF